MVDKSDKVSKIKRLANKAIFKKSPQAKVKVEVQDYDLTTKMQRDKSRFFKTAWEEEKKELFFK